MKKFFYAVLLLLGMSILTVSCNSNKLKGYEWLEGEWVYDKFPQAAAIFTAEYAQMVSYGDGELNVYKAPKEDYKIEIVNDSFLGDLKRVSTSSGNFVYIDDAKKSVFFVYDFDRKCYFEKK